MTGVEAEMNEASVVEENVMGMERETDAADLATEEKDTVMTETEADICDTGWILPRRPCDRKLKLIKGSTKDGKQWEASAKAVARGRSVCKLRVLDVECGPSDPKNIHVVVK